MDHFLTFPNQIPYPLVPVVLLVSLHPCMHQIRTTTLSLDNPAATRYRSTFKMPSSTLHNTTNLVIAEDFVCAKRAFLHGTFEFALESLNEPVNFEVYARIHQAVEMAASVFES